MKKNLVHAAIAALIVILAALALQLTIGTGVDGQGFNWMPSDFVVMGALVFIASLLFSLALNKLGRYRIIAAALLTLAFFWIWAELAVGVFTNWGN